MGASLNPCGTVKRPFRNFLPQMELVGALVRLRFFVAKGLFIKKTNYNLFTQKGKNSEIKGSMSWAFFSNPGQVGIETYQLVRTRIEETKTRPPFFYRRDVPLSGQQNSFERKSKNPALYFLSPDLGPNSARLPSSPRKMNINRAPSSNTPFSYFIFRPFQSILFSFALAR